MQSRFFMLTFLFCIIFIVSNQSDAIESERPTLKIASFPLPPILHMGLNGQFSGTMGETVKMLCEEANINCTFEIVPLKRAYQYLTSGKADALITLNLNQFNECCMPSQWTSPWSAGFFTRLDTETPPKQASDVLNKSLIIVNGMRSPYSFMPDLDLWDKEKRIHLFRALDVQTSVRMFNVKRADLLWGSDDFIWYFQKLKSPKTWEFHALTTNSVVLWVRNEKKEILDKLNISFTKLRAKNMLSEKNLLNDDVMKLRYSDAFFSEAN